MLTLILKLLDEDSVTLEGRRGSKFVCGGEKRRDFGGERVGELSISGGADIDRREFRDPDILRVVFGLGGRRGEDDSAPDWNTLLSSHPLSSVPGPN